MAGTALERFDTQLISLTNRLSDPLSRLALFTVYGWFGLLKIVAESPASPLVQDLLAKTLPFISFDHFIIALGVFEILIGVAFLIPGLERLAVLLLIPHMITTFMPLILLPAVTWSGFLVPTLEGQYIIKNLLIIALAFGLVSHLQPLHWRREHPPPKEDWLCSPVGKSTFKFRAISGTLKVLAFKVIFMRTTIVLAIIVVLVVVGAVVVMMKPSLVLAPVTTPTPEEVTQFAPVDSPTNHVHISVAPSGVPTATPTTSGEATPVAAAAKVTISIGDTAFSPATVTVPVGSTVTFVNNGQASHWPASDPHPTHTGLPGFDAKKELATGETYTFTFDKVGTWGFHDHLNQAMKGSVIVK